MEEGEKLRSSEQDSFNLELSVLLLYPCYSFLNPILKTIKEDITFLLKEH